MALASVACAAPWTAGLDAAAGDTAPAQAGPAATAGSAEAEGTQALTQELEKLKIEISTLEELKKKVAALQSSTTATQQTLIELTIRPTQRSQGAVIIAASDPEGARELPNRFLAHASSAELEDSLVWRSIPFSRAQIVCRPPMAKKVKPHAGRADLGPDQL